MANNRIYLRNKETGDKFMIAKWYGWEFSQRTEGLEKWLEEQLYDETGFKHTDNVSIGLKSNLEVITEDDLIETHKVKK